MEHIKAFFGKIPLTVVYAQRIESFKAQRISKGLKPRIVNKELAVLRFMLNRAVECNYLQANPYKGV
jgi:site-specific recombinase XerC